MEYCFEYNKETKKIVLSAQTPCKWSCVVKNGNFSLNSYYGFWKGNESKAQEITLFTYNTSDMYGDVICKFETDNCVVKRHISIPLTQLHVFHVTQNNVYLFGERTKTYLYVHYGILDLEKSNIDILESLLFSINNTNVYTYEGVYQKIQVSADTIHLYDIELMPYNEINCYIEIIITSQCNHIFNDTISIKGKDNNGDEKTYYTNITQNIVKNAPTLLKISPSIVFLNNKNPIQKINVTSIYKGAPKDYRLSNSISLVTYKEKNYENDVDKYINSTSIMSLKNDDLQMYNYVEKKASHFIIDMSGYKPQNDNIENTKDIAYELYVVQEENPSCFQKLEIFYNYIFDPTNYIGIEQIDGIYGYGSGTTFVECTRISENDIPNPFTLYFTKDDNSSGITAQHGYIYVKYSPTNHIILTVKSTPTWWRINCESDYVKEVKQGNNLQLALESTIPESGTNISLINEKGSIYTFNCKSSNDIFIKNIATFSFSGETLSSMTETIVPSGETEISSIILVSQNEEKKWYYYDTEISIPISSSTIGLKTILYKKNEQDNIISSQTTCHNFEILYNSDIAKYYILYGSITQKVNGEIELNNNNRYYGTIESTIEKNDTLKFIIPLPELTEWIPWTITNRGCGITYDIYKKDTVNPLSIATLDGNETEKWVLINNNNITYKPQKSYTKIGIMRHVPTTTDGLDDFDILLIPHTIIKVNAVSAILFQQFNTLNEVTLFIKLNEIDAENNVYINKYGDTISLNAMKTISSSSVTQAYESLLEKEITNTSALYYASYYKENSFTTVKNNNAITLNILKRGDNEYILMNDKILSEQIIDLFYINGVDTTFAESSIEEKWDYVLSASSATTPINDWNISSGMINFEENGQKISIFPQNNLEYYVSDSGQTEGFIFSSNLEINGNIQWFLAKYKFVEVFIINDKLQYRIYENDDKKYIESFCIYQIIDKSLTYNDKIYVLDNQNILSYKDSNDHQTYKYTAYQDNQKWYINFNKISYNIQKVENNLVFGPDNKWKLNQNYEFVQDGITYYPQIKVNLSGLTLNVLHNLDGGQEEYIIINNIKYVANKNNDGLSIIELNSTNKLSVSGVTSGESPQRYVTFNENYWVNIIIEPSYKYVIIDNVMYKLVNNNVLIYDSKKYTIIQQPNKDTTEYYIVLDNNKGYKVYEQESKYYIILNYNKYEYDMASATFNLPSFSANTSIINCTEIANETFNYELDFDDLLSNNIINGRYNGQLISNAYLSGDTIMLVEKEIYLDKNTYPFQLITKEYVKYETNLSSTTYITLTMKDETNVIVLNGDNKLSYNNSEPFIISGETELFFNSGETLTISGDTTISGETMLIINDYSQIEFSGICKITVKNDCEIQHLGKKYNLFENESLIIDAENSTQEIIFTDVTQLSIEFINEYLKLYVFTDVVEYESQLYIASLINNKKAIIVNGEIYYIYDNKVQISGVTSSIMCHEKSIFYKTLSNSGMTSYIYDVITHKVDNKPTYCYESGNTIQPLSSQTSNMDYTITLPFFNKEKEMWDIQKLNLENIKIYQVNGATYSKATISGHSNINDDIIIENGKLNFIIDCFKISGGISGYTDRYHNYEIESADTTYSFWDYYANTYVKQLYGRNEIKKEYEIQKNIILNNIKTPIDENRYVKINDKYEPVYEFKDYQEIICIVNSNECTYLNTNYNKNINIICLYKGSENDNYVHQFSGMSLTLYYEEDGNIKNDWQIEKFGFNCPFSSSITNNISIVGISISGDNSFDSQQIALAVYSSKSLNSTKINDDTRKIGIEYKNKIYLNGSMSEMTSPTIYQIRQKFLSIPLWCEIKDDNFVLYDINAYSSFNFNYLPSNDAYGVVDNFSVENIVDVEHTEYILLSAKTSEESDKKNYGIYKLNFK